VDGIYDKDPKKFPERQKYTTLSYLDALRQRLDVHGLSRFSLFASIIPCPSSSYLGDPAGIRKAVLGQRHGPLVQ